MQSLVSYQKRGQLSFVFDKFFCNFSYFFPLVVFVKLPKLLLWGVIKNRSLQFPLLHVPTRNLRTKRGKKEPMELSFLKFSIKNATCFKQKNTFSMKCVLRKVSEINTTLITQEHSNSIFQVMEHISFISAIVLFTIVMLPYSSLEVWTYVSFEHQ